MWSAPRRTPGEFVAFQRRAYERAMVILRVFYGISVVWALDATSSSALEYSRLERAKPLWPARVWFDHVSVHNGVGIIFGGYVVASILALVLPEQRLARFAYSFMLLQYMAFVNSFGKINHSMHAWLFTSAIFILLPSGRWRQRATLATRRYFLTVVWCAQLVVLFTYSMTGIWKVVIALRDTATGHVSGFNFSGFSYIVAARLEGVSSETVLGNFFVRHELIGWALFVGTMIVETTSIIVAFRPRLHRAWGVLLIIFHVGTNLVLGFTFTQNIVLVTLILVCSPLAPEHIDFKEALLDLPGVHFVARRVAGTRAKRPPATDGDEAGDPLAGAHAS